MVREGREGARAGVKRCYLPGTSFTATGSSSNLIRSWLEVPRLVRDDGPILAVGLASIELRHGHSGMPVCEKGGSCGADTRGANSSDPRHRCVGLGTSLTDIASHSTEERTGRLSSSSRVAGEFVTSRPGGTARGTATLSLRVRRLRRRSLRDTLLVEHEQLAQALLKSEQPARLPHSPCIERSISQPCTSTSDS